MKQVEPFFDKGLTNDERLLVFWNEYHTLNSELEIWRYACRELGIKPLPEVSSAYMFNEFERLALRKIKDPQKAQNYIKNLTEQKKKIILGVIAKEKTHGIYYGLLAKTIKRAKSEVKNFANSEVYVTSFSRRERRERRLQNVMDEVSRREKALRTLKD